MMPRHMYHSHITDLYAQQAKAYTISKSGTPVTIHHHIYGVPCESLEHESYLDGNRVEKVESNVPGIEFGG